MCKLLAVGLIVLVLAAGLVFRYVQPLWLAALIVVGSLFLLMAGLRWLLPAMLKRAIVGPLKAKSAVLRGARVEVHQVMAVAPPTPAQDGADEEEIDGEEPDWEEEEEDLDTSPRRYYLIDVTITPQPASGPFTHWDIDDLTMRPMEAPPESLEGEAEEDEAMERAVRIEDLAKEEAGEFQLDFEDSKIEGPARLQLVVGVREGYQRLKFRYYFEDFGEITLPA